VKRTFWYRELGVTDSEDFDPETVANNPSVPASEDDANLIGSLVADDTHAPVLDIDYEARLVPSSTEGHYHLYLDREVPWEKYVAVLEVLADAGIIQKGFARASIARKQTFVRKPGVTK